MDAVEFSSKGGKVKISWDFDGDYIVVVDAKAYGFHGHSDGLVTDRWIRHGI